MAVRQWRGWWQALALAAGIIAVGAAVRAAEDSSEARMKKDITYLASDECEGRGPGTKGINLAADYIANEFKKAGLKPGGADGSYFQPFTMNGPSRLDAPSTLTLTGPLGQEIELAVDRDFRPMGMGSGSTHNVPIVFAGYGATAKEINYDDYKDVDVDGKIVLMLRRAPRADNPHAPFDGSRSGRHTSLAMKMAVAQMNKPAAVIVVNDLGSARGGDPLMEFAYSAAAGGSSRVPALQVRRSVANAMVQSALGTTLEELEQDIDRDLKPRSAALKGWTGSLDVRVSRPKLAVKNVVGVLEGNGPLAKETLVFGAHYDHLGYGGPNSLSGDRKQAIHHGADDNASGTTMLMELARRFAQKGKNSRRLVFMAFSGEESGLLGSEHYVKNPLFPLLDTTAMINMDMVGRLRPDKADPQKEELEVWGTGTAKTFDKLIDGFNKPYNFKLKKVAGGSGPSDHSSFYSQKVPVYFFFTGLHPDYHKPSDTADKINIAGMKKIADMVEELGTHLGSVAERPEYVKVQGGPARPSPFNGPRLGIQPDYSEEDGVSVKAVSAGGPAAKAGIKDGDRIVEIAGKPVKNMTNYMAIMGVQKKGETIQVGVLREGKKVSVKVLLE